MIVAITPKWKFVCERCGKEKFPKDDGKQYLKGGSKYVEGET